MEKLHLGCFLYKRSSVIKEVASGPVRPSSFTGSVKSCKIRQATVIYKRKTKNPQLPLRQKLLNVRTLPRSYHMIISMACSWSGDPPFLGTSHSWRCPGLRTEEFHWSDTFRRSSFTKHPDVPTCLSQMSH